MKLRERRRKKTTNDDQFLFSPLSSPSFPSFLPLDRMAQKPTHTKELAQDATINTPSMLQIVLSRLTRPETKVKSRMLREVNPKNCKKK